MIELLQKLPKDAQDKITLLAQDDSDRLCKRYDFTLSDQKNTVYHYYMSKRIRLAWFNQVMFEKADPIDIIDLGRMFGYYQHLMDELLKPENLSDRKSSKRDEERKQKEAIQEMFDAIKESPVTRPLLHRQFPDKA